MGTEHMAQVSGWMPAFVRALTPRSIALTLALGTLVAAALSPIFHTDFVSLLTRVLLVALLLLLAFTAAGHARQTLLPRWIAQLLAIAVTAPLATAAVYVLSGGGDIGAFVRNHARVMGFMWIAGTGVVVGVVLALAALYRERDAQARAQELQFALEKSTLERKALDARLRLLHAQIEPHFLFNTLANVQALVESGSARAAPVLQSLIAYLRAAVPQLGDLHATLGAEASLVGAYLEVMHLRMPDRLHYEVRIDSDLAELRFPPMALLTLVENAVRHGVDPSEEGAHIEVGARRATNGALRLWVKDTGVGMQDNAPAGTGFTNLRARLEAFYGSRARLELNENVPRGLSAEIVIEAPPS